MAYAQLYSAGRDGQMYRVYCYHCMSSRLRRRANTPTGQRQWRCEICHCWQTEDQLVVGDLAPRQVDAIRANEAATQEMVDGGKTSAAR